MISNEQRTQEMALNDRIRVDRRRLIQSTAAASVAGAGLASSALATHTTAAQENSGSDRLFRVGGGQAASWVRNFNPLVQDSLRPTQYGIYEPLFVYATTNGTTTPWLATEWAFNEDNTVLTFTIRDGVNWSDGEPFTANDVAFTFNLLNEHSGLSGSGGIRGVLDSVASFEAPDDTTFVVNFSQVFTPGLYLIGAQSIVPQHIWAEIEDPVTFANENPVGTGPFTEVGDFRPQYFELLKNPNYWQEGKPAIAGLAYPSYGSNDAGTLGLINDEFDWMGMFIPDIENTFVSVDPEHYSYWFPLNSGCIGIFFNYARAPFDDVNVRKAFSMAIDREQICSIAMYDYTVPADATGMSNLYDKWKSAEVIEAGQQLVSLDIEEANRLLDEAGYTLDGDVRRTPDGEPMEYEIIMPSGWSDWMQAGQLLGQQLTQIGVKVSPKGIESTTWYEQTYTGEFDLSLGSTGASATPFDHFLNLMSNRTLRPVGETATTNWHRFGNDEATELVDAFAGTSDEAEQMGIAHQLQELFLEHWPVAPIYPGPRWSQMNSLHFEDSAGRQTPTLSQVIQHQALQDAVAIGYSITVGCPVFILKHRDEVQERDRDALNIFETLGVETAYKTKEAGSADR